MSCFLFADSGVCRTGICKEGLSPPFGQTEALPENTMYSKPLAARMDGPREAPAKVKRGAPLTGAINFSSFLQPGGLASPGLPGQGAGKGAGGGNSPLEQAGMQNTMGLNQMRALASLAAAQAKSGGPAKNNALPAQGQNLGLPLNPSDLFKLLTRKPPDAKTVKTAERAAPQNKDSARQAQGSESLKTALAGFRQNTGGEDGIGSLAARFESGGKGISAIGYDRHGGTSYGKYQLSSRAGTMRSFIEYCKTEAPDIAKRLEEAGGSLNTGGRRGKVPAAWEKIAGEQPDRFEALQDKFIRASHFEPAMRAIAEKTGLDQDDMPVALREVVFSTAVQHGPYAASRIISRALDQVGPDRLNAEENQPATLAKAQENLIRKIYDNRSGQFRSSTREVQTSVKSRLRQEMSVAISMLHQERAA